MVTITVHCKKIKILFAVNRRKSLVLQPCPSCDSSIHFIHLSDNSREYSCYWGVWHVVTQIIGISNNIRIFPYPTTTYEHPGEGGIPSEKLSVRLIRYFIRYVLNKAMRQNNWFYYGKSLHFPDECPLRPVTGQIILDDQPPQSQIRRASLRVCDGPALKKLNQRRINVGWSMEDCNSFYQTLLNVGPASPTLAQHWVKSGQILAAPSLADASVSCCCWPARFVLLPAPRASGHICRLISEQLTIAGSPFPTWLPLILPPNASGCLFIFVRQASTQRLPPSGWLRDAATCFFLAPPAWPERILSALSFLKLLKGLAQAKILKKIGDFILA